jgi:hypothetical protein
MAVLLPGCEVPCIGSMGHLFKKCLFDNDFYAFQAPLCVQMSRVASTGMRVWRQVK